MALGVLVAAAAAAVVVTRSGVCVPGLDDSKVPIQPLCEEHGLSQKILCDTWNLLMVSRMTVATPTTVVIRLMDKILHYAL